MKLKMNFLIMDTFLTVFRLECLAASTELLKFVVLLILHSPPIIFLGVNCNLEVKQESSAFLEILEKVLYLQFLVHPVLLVLLTNQQVCSRHLDLQRLLLSENMLDLVHSENSVVQRSLSPSIHWRSKCSSPLLVLLEFHPSHSVILEMAIYSRLMELLIAPHLHIMVLVLSVSGPRNQDLMLTLKRSIPKYTILTLIVFNQSMIMVHLLTQHFHSVRLQVV
ncbi:MAG: hypothetical protein CMN91_12160 [Synechococcus sp. ARS1019]|nr:hypothetical protein [Synechococcus sp. ARS1019]